MTDVRYVVQGVACGAAIMLVVVFLTNQFGF